MLIWLGLIGALGSGKSSAIEHLSILFPQVRALSLSDLLRQDLRAQGIEITRHTCRDHAHRLRQQYGGDVLMQRALVALAGATEGINVVDGIRNLEELSTFKGRTNAFAIGFPADRTVRSERVFRRLRPDDQLSQEELLAVMDEEMAPGPVWGFNLPNCLGAADFTVDANRSLDEANRQLAMIMQEVLNRCS